DYAEAREVKTESELLRVRDGELVQAGHGWSAGVGIRVLLRGTWGFASVPNDDGTAPAAAGPAEARLLACAQAALAAARAAAQVTPGQVRLADEEPQRGQYATPVAEDPFAVPLERKIGALMAPIDLLRRDPRIRSANAHVLFRRIRKRLLTS